MPKEVNARLIAFNILIRLEEQRSNSNVLLQEALSRMPDAADRNLVTDLVLGTLRRRGTLLHYITRFSRRALKQIDPRVQVILQMGIYQLLYTRIPHHAAIYETVNVCRRIKMTSAASFTNGILRAVQGKLLEMEEPPAPADRYSHPEWLAERWIAKYGEAEASALMQGNNESPSPILRVNELRFSPADVERRLHEEDVHVTPVGSASGLFRVTAGAPQLTHSFADGEFYIHDAGVETLGELMGVAAGMHVLEIAAAPGGKTFQLALRMKDTGRIFSVDSDLRRMKMWRRNIERLGIHSAIPVIADALTIPFDSEFDLVVVDAPCSSLGVVRRHPEIKWWRTPQELPEFGALQLRILQSCARCVKKGGALVYSVCSFEPEETTDVTAQFLALHPDFRETNARTLLPHRDHTDGFFIARFER